MDKNNRDYSNGEITVHWKPSACVHSTICYVRLRSVFDPLKRPWVNMQGASTEKIIDIVNQCPTEALTFSWNNDQKQSEKEEDKKDNKTEIKTSEKSTKIQIIKDGPAIITGDFSIVDIDGNKLAHANTATLCRCGHSSNLPFCDGSHRKSDFTDKRE